MSWNKFIYIINFNFKTKILGCVYVEMKNYEESLKCFNQALDSDPKPENSEYIRQIKILSN